MKENPALYLSFAAFCLFSVAVQVFFPYLIIYMQNYLHFDGYALVLGIVLIFASVVSVLSGRVIDRLGELTCVLPAAGVMFAGLVGIRAVDAGRDRDRVRNDVGLHAGDGHPLRRHP